MIRRQRQKFWSIIPNNKLVLENIPSTFRKKIAETEIITPQTSENSRAERQSHRPQDSIPSRTTDTRATYSERNAERDISQLKSGYDQQQHQQYSDRDLVVNRWEGLGCGRFIDCFGELLFVFVLLLEGLVRSVELLLQRLDLTRKELQTKPSRNSGSPTPVVS